jgi:hypothetical protein
MEVSGPDGDGGERFLRTLSTPGATFDQIVEAAAEIRDPQVGSALRRGSARVPARLLTPQRAHTHGSASRCGGGLA